MKRPVILGVLSVVLSILLWVVIFAPHLVLKVPKIGFILYAILGHEVPPYFDGKIFEHDQAWLRKGDVVIAACTKCGTTWGT